METDYRKCVNKESIIVLEGKTKAEVFKEILDAAVEISPVERDIMERALWQREKMMTTGLGQTFALPHIRLKNMINPIIFIAVCRNEIKDYKTPDDKPVRLIVFLAAPEDFQNDYLKLLGSISGKFKDEAFIEEVNSLIDKKSKIYTLIRK
jgi:mannitol/fructose-specific phosphotransferase system IIA component (Ntr-type)